jgi:hypothetical protein
MFIHSYPRLNTPFRLCEQQTGDIQTVMSGKASSNAPCYQPVSIFVKVFVSLRPCGKAPKARELMGLPKYESVPKARKSKA